MRRIFLVVAVTASLSGPGTFETLWSFVSSLWSGSATIDAGCIWDPSGQCRPAPQTDEGCIWDPSGQCRPAPQTDAGCGWDPDGQCHS